MALRREPIFNVPPILLVTIVALAIVHAVRTLWFTPRDDVQFLLLFAFIPARFDVAPGVMPGGFGAEIWTFVSYAFIHGNLTHLALNSVWLLAFGSPVARRFGALRFAIFFAVTAAAGAAVHLAAHAGDLLPVVGASAAISGCMAAAIRFVFQIGGPLGVMQGGRAASYRRPAAPLLVTLRNGRVLIFLAVWFGLNLIFGVGSLSLDDGEESVAWEAHIGGFLAGLLLFPLFDPVPRYGSDDDLPAPRTELAP